MTLTDFLLARIAEDEQLAGGDMPAKPRDWQLTQIDDSRSWDLLAVSCRRVLAECDAKRRIVTTWALLDECPPPMPTEPTRHIAAGYRDVLAMLAEVYADHPDYRDEWRA